MLLSNHPATLYTGYGDHDGGLLLLLIHIVVVGILGCAVAFV